MLSGVGHRPFLPKQLLRGPFTIHDARRAGLTRWQLESLAWTRLGPSTYVSSALRDEPMHRLAAVIHRLPRGAAFSRLTAAWLHGMAVAPCDPVEATVPQDAGVSARAGVALRRSGFAKGDVVQVRGMPATSIVRTLGEVCGRLGLVEAVILADSAMHDRRVKLAQLTSWADANAGRRGIKKLRQVLQHVEPAAESPMESRLRMLLVLAGLPRPKVQVSIHDRWGRFVGRPDLYYPEHRLGIEYDGDVHRNTLAEDNRRQNRLLNTGVHLLRFTAGDVLGNPESVVSQVSAYLTKPARAGARVIRGQGLPATAGARGESRQG